MLLTVECLNLQCVFKSVCISWYICVHRCTGWKQSYIWSSSGCHISVRLCVLIQCPKKETRSPFPAKNLRFSKPTFNCAFRLSALFLHLNYFPASGASAPDVAHNLGSSFSPPIFHNSLVTVILRTQTQKLFSSFSHSSLSF